jgi:hypothetical protein
MKYLQLTANEVGLCYGDLYWNLHVRFKNTLTASWYRKVDCRLYVKLSIQSNNLLRRLER